MQGMTRNAQWGTGPAFIPDTRIMLSGQIKEAVGFRRFSLRGKTNVTAEWHLVCASHDLAKLFRSSRAGRDERKLLVKWSARRR